VPGTGRGPFADHRPPFGDLPLDRTPERADALRMWKRIDFGVKGTALVVVSSFLPFVDEKWVSAGCADNGPKTSVLSVVAILGWLTGAAILVIALGRARREGKTWRDLLLLPAIGASLLGFVLLAGYAFASDCGGGIVW
jgi:hypothetical protein